MAERRITHAELTELLREVGPRHHAAFAASDGVDPEWPMWYAGYLQAHLWDRAGRLPTRSELVHVLVRADREYRASGEAGPWPPFYARLLLAELESASDA